MKKILFIFLSLLFIQPMQLLAWGADGHKIVAEIAKTVLKKNIRDSVQFYLEHTSFEEASVWMDEMRGNSKYDYLKPMHYINIEKDNTYVKKDEPNIINELESVISQLQKRKASTKTEIKMVLQILFHLIGDLHQPLHVGYGKDKGGNNIHLIYKNKKSNLHKIWDSEIISSQNIQLNECLIQLNSMSKRDKMNIQKIDLINWMNDSRMLIKNVYDFKGDTVEDDYAIKNAKLIELQLIKAGLRLAAVLEDCFGR